MSDDKQRRVPVLQFLRKPVARLRVEVVRRFVEEGVFRAPDEHLGERDAHLPAAREVGATLLAVALGETEAVEHAADARLDAVAVHRLELLEEGGLAFDQAVEVTLAAFDLGGDAFEFEFDRAGFGEGFPEFLDEGVGVGEAGLLAKVAEGRAAVSGRPRVDGVVACEQPQDGGLTAAVGADKAHMFTVPDDERKAANDVVRPEGFGSVFCEEHGCTFRERPRRRRRAGAGDVRMSGRRNPAGHGRGSNERRRQAGLTPAAVCSSVPGNQQTTSLR